MERTKLCNLLAVAMLIISSCMMLFTKVLSVVWMDSYGNIGINSYTFIDNSIKVLYQYGEIYHVVMLTAIGIAIISAIAILLNKVTVGENLVLILALLVGVVWCASNKLGELTIINPQMFMLMTFITVALFSCKCSKTFRLKEIKSEK